MDSFEINKIVAAVLMVALLVIGIGKLSDVIFHVEKPETPGYSVEVEDCHYCIHNQLKHDVRQN